MTKTNIILIDFENVQQINAELLSDENFLVKIFAGSNQNKVPISLIQSLQKFGDRVEWIQLTSSGPNALDFHIAYTLGKLSTKYPDAFFHIISKDKGFDPLLKTLKAEKILCLREESIESIPLLKLKMAQPNERINLLKQKLRHGPKPRRRSTLFNSIRAMFLNKIEEAEINILIDSLAQQKVISFDGEKIVYIESGDLEQ